jgi:hypothetical protein
MESQQQLGRLYGNVSQEVYAGAPQHMNWLAENSPRADAEWRQMLTQRGVDFASSTLLRSEETHPLTKEYGGRTLRLPQGFASVSSKLVARSFLPEAIFDENTSAALQAYCQRDKVNASFYDVVYLSGNSVGVTRHFYYDPALPASVYQETEGYLSLLDLALYDAIRQAHEGQDYTNLPQELAGKKLENREWSIQAGYANRKLLAGSVAFISKIP